MVHTHAGRSGLVLRLAVALAVGVGVGTLVWLWLGDACTEEWCGPLQRLSWLIPAVTLSVPPALGVLATRIGWRPDFSGVPPSADAVTGRLLPGEQVELSVPAWSGEPPANHPDAPGEETLRVVGTSLGRVRIVRAEEFGSETVDAPRYGAPTVRVGRARGGRVRLDLRWGSQDADRPGVPDSLTLWCANTDVDALRVWGDRHPLVDAHLRMQFERAYHPETRYGLYLDWARATSDPVAARRMAAQAVELGAELNAEERTTGYTDLARTVRDRHPPVESITGMLARGAFDEALVLLRSWGDVYGASRVHVAAAGALRSTPGAARAHLERAIALQAALWPALSAPEQSLLGHETSRLRATLDELP